MSSGGARRTFFGISSGQSRIDLNERRGAARRIPWPRAGHEKPVGGGFLTHQSSAHASQQTVRTSTRTNCGWTAMLRAQTKALDGDQSLDLRCTGVVERNPEAFCARRSLIGLLCGPAFSASFESPSGRHHQSFQRPFRHARETPTRPELPPAALGRQDAAACQDAFACTSSAPKLRQSQNWTPIDARRSWLLGASPLGNGRSS
jgi:hypothetical protein